MLVCALPLVAFSQAKSTGPQRDERTTDAQTPSSKPYPDQLPDETTLPEEDESVAPKVYPLDPLQSERCIRVGDFYMHKGEARGYRAALGRFEDATKYNPSSAEAFFKVAEAEEKLKNSDAARHAYQRVIQLAPDSKLGREAKKKIANKS